VQIETPQGSGDQDQSEDEHQDYQLTPNDSTEKTKVPKQLTPILAIKRNSIKFKSDKIPSRFYVRQKN
jgi:hypothetical protein